MLTRTEEMLLLAVCRLQAEAFGLKIREEVESITGRRYSVGGVYVPLERLVKKGLLARKQGESNGSRLGRPRRLYRITAAGLEALREARELQESMWSSLPDALAEQLRFSI